MIQEGRRLWDETIQDYFAPTVVIQITNHKTASYKPCSSQQCSEEHRSVSHPVWQYWGCRHQCWGPSSIKLSRSWTWSIDEHSTQNVRPLVTVTIAYSLIHDRLQLATLLVVQWKKTARLSFWEWFQLIYIRRIHQTKISIGTSNKLYVKHFRQYIQGHASDTLKQLFFILTVLIFLADARDDL